MTLRSLALATTLLAALQACGDATFIVGTTFGIVTEDASCGGDAGRFPIQSSGFVLIVRLDSNSRIFLANGQPGSCRDIRAGQQASVSGSTGSSSIRADEVRLSAPTPR